MEDKDCFGKTCFIESSQYCHWRLRAFMGESKETLLIFVVSQLSSAQNNPYVKVVYFKVAYSDPLQHQRICGHILKLLHLSFVARQSSWSSSYVSDILTSIYGSLYYSCSLNAGFLEDSVLLTPHIFSYTLIYHLWANDSLTQEF